MRFLELLSPKVGLHISWFFGSFGLMVIGFSEEVWPLYGLGCLSMGVLAFRLICAGVSTVYREAKKKPEEMVKVTLGGQSAMVPLSVFKSLHDDALSLSNDQWVQKLSKYFGPMQWDVRTQAWVPKATTPAALVPKVTTAVWGYTPTTGPWPAPTTQEQLVDSKPSNPNVDNLPLRQDVINGFRSYDIIWQEGRIALKGKYSHIWTTRHMTAVCVSGGTARADEEQCRNHLASLQCECGIYAHDTLEKCSGTVVARVVAFGIVWPHTAGWRASEARIEEIFYRPSSDSPFELEVGKALGEQFGVPVRVPQKPNPALWDENVNRALPGSISLPANVVDPYFVNGFTNGGGSYPRVNPPKAGPSYQANWS